VDNLRGESSGAELISKHFLGKDSDNNYRDCWWPHEYGILRIEGRVEIMDGEIALSSFTNATSGQEWDKNAQARSSNAQESGMVFNGQRIAQRVVLWELLGTQKEPGDMDRRRLGICIRDKEGHK
jgi:hypothetical protein